MTLCRFDVRQTRRPAFGWDTWPIEQINRNPEVLAGQLESYITAVHRAAWTEGGVEGWVLEGARLAQTVAYGDLDSKKPAPITATNEQQADPAIEPSAGEGRR